MREQPAPWKKHKRQPEASRRRCEEPALWKKPNHEECNRWGRDRQSGQWSRHERWYQGKRWYQDDEKWSPPEQSWQEPHIQDWPTKLGRCSPRVARLPQKLPTVNFYSFGRTSREVPRAVDGHNNGIVRQYLWDTFRLVDPLVFDVEHWNDLWGSTHPTHWELDKQTMKRISKHWVWSELVAQVRPVIESQVGQLYSIVNIVFAYSY